MSKLLLLLVIFFRLCCGEEQIIFYDLKTNEPLGPPITTVVPHSENSSITMENIVNIRLPFIGQPCGCFDYQCGCCAGMSMDSFNFNQKMCMNFTYDPNEFEILMDMNMNDNSVYSNSMSGKNPDPVCLPVPTGPIPLGLEMCVKMFNIFTPGYNLHMCMDIFAQIQQSPIVILHFDCMRFGRDEVAFLKPEDNGGLGGEEGQEVGEEGAVIYDTLPPEKETKIVEVIENGKRI